MAPEKPKFNFSPEIARVMRDPEGLAAFIKLNETAMEVTGSVDSYILFEVLPEYGDVDLWRQYFDYFSTSEDPRLRGLSGGALVPLVGADPENEDYYVERWAALLNDQDESVVMWAYEAFFEDLEDEEMKVGRRLLSQVNFEVIHRLASEKTPKLD